MKKLELGRCQEQRIKTMITYQLSRKNLKLEENKNMVSELIKRKEDYTFRNILERSKMIGKKVMISIFNN